MSSSRVEVRSDNINHNNIIQFISGRIHSLHICNNIFVFDVLSSNPGVSKLFYSRAIYKLKKSLIAITYN